MKKLIATGALLLALGLLSAPSQAEPNYTYAAEIFSVHHTGVGPNGETGGTWMKTGDTVQVEATGTPGSHMTFDIGENAPGNAMTEVSPGKYVGKFTLEPRHFIHQQVWITVHSTEDGVNRTYIDAAPLVLAP